MINKLAIIGVGLIGASLARALKQAGYVGEVVGYGRTMSMLEQAVASGVIDRAEVTAAKCVDGAEVIIVAVPVGDTTDILKTIASRLDDETVITDVGSVKTTVVAAARAVLNKRFPSFVPGHPLAGSERSGLTAATPELFRGRRVVLTPEPETDQEAVDRVGAMWRAAGAEIKILTAAEHDRLLAMSSHLPQLLATALMDQIQQRDDRQDVLELTAGGFRDMTRLAASDPVMWRDICLANRDALLGVLDEFREGIGGIRQAVQNGDAQALMEIFSRSKAAREKLVDD